MSRYLSSSVEQTPLSSLSAASSYSSLINCDETNSIDLEQDSTPKQNHSEMNVKPYENIHKRSSHSTLLNRHVKRLCSLIEKPVEIHGQGNFPTLNIVCKDFLIELRKTFQLNKIEIKDIRLNGGSFRACENRCSNNEKCFWVCLSFISRRCVVRSNRRQIVFLHRH